MTEVEISDIFKESYRNQSRLLDLRPEVEEILSKVLKDLENDKTNEKAPHNIESSLFTNNINLIPSDFYGQCTDLLIVLCYDKDDIYYRFKEGLDNAIEKCYGINKDIYFISTQWHSNKVKELSGYIKSVRQNDVRITFIHVTVNGCVIMPS